MSAPLLDSDLVAGITPRAPQLVAIRHTDQHPPQDLTKIAGACAPGVVRVVTAARCLREGVDVCAVDAVLLAAPLGDLRLVTRARPRRDHYGCSSEMHGLQGLISS